MKIKKIDNFHWEYKGRMIFKMNSKCFRVTDLSNDDSDTNSFEYPETSIKKMCAYIDSI